MHTYRLIFILMLFLCGLLARAQRVLKFTVLEEGTELPVISAAVALSYTGDFSAPDVLAVTDADGVATVSLGKGVVHAHYRVSSLGFVTLQGDVPNSVTDVRLFMKEDVMKVNEVVVTGSRAARPIKLSPVSTQVIGGKQLVEAGYGNLQQALQQETPGLNIQKVGFGNEISMQGLDARHVLFLMDGERMTGDMAGNLDYERFNLHAIDRIEVVKGASSTLYGSRASGAVINLITKKTSKPIDIQAGARWGQMNEKNYKSLSKYDFLYMYEKNADKPNLQGWVSAGFKAGKHLTSQTDVWYSSSDAFFMYQDGKDRKLYTAEANPFLVSDTLVVSSAERPPMGIEGTEHISAQQKIFIDPCDGLSILAYGSYFFMNSYDLVQDMIFSQSEDWTVGGKLYWTFKDWFKLTLSMHADFYERFKRHERIDRRLKVYDSKIIQPRLSLSSSYFDGHELILGVEGISDDLVSDRFNGDASHTMRRRTLRETEYFIQDEWAISPQWMLSAGVRSNFSKAFGLMAMPKLAVKWTASPVWAFRANYSMGYRSPSIKELFFNWDHLGMFMIKGNESLQPEKNNYFSLGAEFSDDSFFLSANAYANVFHDKIEGVWRVYDMQYNFEYTNLSSQRLLGVEALLRWHFLDRFTLNGTYSYVDVSSLDGIRVSSTSPHAATGSIDYRVSLRNYRFGVTFSASFMGAKKFDVQDRLTIDGASRNAYFRCELPAYAICNVSVSQTFFNKFKLTAGVDNVFNYVPETLGSGVTVFNVPASPGARFHIQAEVLFDEVVRALKRKNL